MAVFWDDSQRMDLYIAGISVGQLEHKTMRLRVVYQQCVTQTVDWDLKQRNNAIYELSVSTGEKFQI